MRHTTIRKFISKNILGINESKVSIKTGNTEQAIALFELAKLRMLAVNYWHDMAGILIPVFQLTDVSGKLVYKSAEPDTLIRIDIPGSVNLQQEEIYDWIYIESIIHEKNTHENIEFVILQVKPISNPVLHRDDIHLYQEAFKTNFIIERNGSKITACVRSEIATLNSNTFFNKIRNLMVLDKIKTNSVKLNWSALLESWIYTP